MYNVFWISNPLPLFPLYTFKPGNIPPNNERITKLHDKSDCAEYINNENNWGKKDLKK
jgi:hypothetical protein